MTLASAPPPAAVALAQHWLTHEPLTALANFTWVNNVSLGAAHCRFASGNDHCLAQHTGLPFTAVSVQGHNVDMLRGLAAELLAPGQPAYSLLPPSVSNLLYSAAQVLESQAEWQMLYRGDPAKLDPGPARLLTAADLPAMLTLAAGEAMVFSADSLARGDFFGVYAGDELVAMGGIQTRLAGYVEIGSIVTHPQHRRRGHATQVVAALIRHLNAEQQRIFLCLFQTNASARRLYEKLGFDLINDLHLLRWQLRK